MVGTRVAAQAVGSKVAAQMVRTRVAVQAQTVVKYNTFYIHHPGGAQRPWGGVYPTCCFTAVCIYTKKWSTPAIFFFSRPKPGGGVYI